jgi:hypothetical protein
MLAIYLTPIYISIIFLVYRIIKQWLIQIKQEKFKYLIFTIFLINTVMILLGPLMKNNILTIIGVNWLFISGLMSFTVFFVKIISKVYKKIMKNHLFKNRKKGILSVFIITIVIFTSIFTEGFIHADKIYINHFIVESNKPIPNNNLKIALVADLHMGNNFGEKQVSKMVELINQEQVDLVVFAGDFFDNNYDAIDNPSAISLKISSIRSTYGNYGCMGNHDINELIVAGFTFADQDKVMVDHRFEQLLKDGGINILRDEKIKIAGNITLVGRKDPQRSSKLKEDRLNPVELLQDIDQKNYVIVMDHQPDELHQLADEGCDLDLSGHVHDGQIFPANLLMNLKWDNPYGYQQIEKMASIVTSGIGTWGPKLRFGTNAEIAIIEVRGI